MHFFGSGEIGGRALTVCGGGGGGERGKEKKKLILLSANERAKRARERSFFPFLHLSRFLFILHFLTRGASCGLRR